MLITPIQRIPRIILLLQSKHLSFIAKQLPKSVIIARKKYFAAHNYKLHVHVKHILLLVYIFLHPGNQAAKLVCMQVATSI